MNAPALDDLARQSEGCDMREIEREQVRRANRRMVRRALAWLADLPNRPCVVAIGICAIVLSATGWDDRAAEVERAKHRCELPSDGTWIVAHFDTRSRLPVCNQIEGPMQ